MIKCHNGGVTWKDGVPVPLDHKGAQAELQSSPAMGREGTMAYSILRAHDSSSDAGSMRIRFDSLISHDITYVGIIQTARASGLTRFPVPYVMTNCHNSLCAVGGTINEDDHVFGLSAAKHYGGIYVPANQAVIHQYARETMSAAGAMILGSDSHTRYGALGTMGIGEGGPEIVKQLLENTYDIAAPEVVLVYLTGTPRQGVGPHDVAIALCGATYQSGFVKNKVLEFAGPGIAALPMDFRIGIDVMTTETTCLSSIWETDERVRAYYQQHGRPDDFRALSPKDGAYYDAMIQIDLSAVEPMIAMPFHPSHAFTIRDVQANAGDILREVEKKANAQLSANAHIQLVDKLVDGTLCVDQGIIAGCAGGMYDNIAEAAQILAGASVGDDYFSLSIYPPSTPVNLALIRDGIQARLMEAGALFKPCFCGPCFGAGDVPSNNGLSIRHTTRNFPNREGSKPGDGQIASVALMDARSIAATAKNGGRLTAATQIEYEMPAQNDLPLDMGAYQRRVYHGYQAPKPDVSLRFGPNIADWPKIEPLSENALYKLCAVIHDPVTTTDELIPSGETSSYRSNPMRLAEYTLSRREPAYVGRAKEVEALERERLSGESPQELLEVLSWVGDADSLMQSTQFASAIFANRPGDGSAREQAASCQRVLGGGANVCYEYATKRYRSNLINWGILPFTIDDNTPFDYQPGDYLFVPDIRRAVEKGIPVLMAKLITQRGITDILLRLEGLTSEEREILLRGCLMNYYASQREGK